jgi:hypothetical protein
MASLWYFFAARDYSGTGLGARLTGLQPSWTLLKRLEDNTDILPTPTIVEAGLGLYKFAYDSEANGDAIGQVDLLGGGNPANLQLDPCDRYLDVAATRESSRLISAVNANGQVALAPGGLDAIPIEKGVNARQALSPILAASAGVLLGAGTGTVVIKGGNTTITRITASTDHAGDRTAVTLALPT